MGDLRELATAALVVGLAAAGCGVQPLPTTVEPSPPASSPATPSPSASEPKSSVSSANRWIAYQGMGINSQDSLFLVRTDGADDHEILTDLPGERLHPDFSRDGTKLAFEHLDENDRSQTFAANSDGSNPQLLAECKNTCKQHFEPAWAPDGRHLAVATTTIVDSSRVGIAVVDVRTQKVHQVLEDDEATHGVVHFPRWSPDGSQLVFWRARPQPDGTVETAVFVVGVDGKNLKQLTPWNMLGGDPDWSPTDSLIVFNTRPLVDTKRWANPSCM